MSLWGQPGIFGPQPGSLSFQLDHTQGAGQLDEYGYPLIFKVKVQFTVKLSTLVV